MNEKCKHENGFMTRWVQAYTTLYGWDGEAWSSEGGGGGLGGEVAYCMDCEMRLGRLRWKDGRPLIEGQTASVWIQMLRTERKEGET